MWRMPREDGITIARQAVVAVGPPIAVVVEGAGPPVIANAVGDPHRAVAVVVAVRSLPTAGVLADSVTRDRSGPTHSCV